jgi:hypothetical protein
MTGCGLGCLVSPEYFGTQNGLWDYPYLKHYAERDYGGKVNMSIFDNMYTYFYSWFRRGFEPVIKVGCDECVSCRR